MVDDDDLFLNDIGDISDILADPKPTPKKAKKWPRKAFAQPFVDRVSQRSPPVGLYAGEDVQVKSAEFVKPLGDQIYDAFDLVDPTFEDERTRAPRRPISRESQRDEFEGSARRRKISLDQWTGFEDDKSGRRDQPDDRWSYKDDLEDDRRARNGDRRFDRRPKYDKHRRPDGSPTDDREEFYERDSYDRKYERRDGYKGSRDRPYFEGSYMDRPSPEGYDRGDRPRRDDRDRSESGRYSKHEDHGRSRYVDDDFTNTESSRYIDEKDSFGHTPEHKEESVRKRTVAEDRDERNIEEDFESFPKRNIAKEIKNDKEQKSLFVLNMTPKDKTAVDKDVIVLDDDTPDAKVAKPKIVTESRKLDEASTSQKSIKWKTSVTELSPPGTLPERNVTVLTPPGVLPENIDKAVAPAPMESLNRPILVSETTSMPFSTPEVRPSMVQPQMFQPQVMTGFNPSYNMYYGNYQPQIRPNITPMPYVGNINHNTMENNWISAPVNPAANNVNIVEDGIQKEIRQQNENLMAQRQQYYQKFDVLNTQLERLKKEKKELMNKKSYKAENFVKDNMKLQEEIQKELKAAKDVIDMLTSIIEKDEKLNLGCRKEQTQRDGDTSMELSKTRGNRSRSPDGSRSRRRSRSRSRSRHRSKSRHRRALPKSRLRSRSRNNRSRSRRRIRRSYSRSRSYSPSSRSRHRWSRSKSKQGSSSESESDKKKSDRKVEAVVEPKNVEPKITKPKSIVDVNQLSDSLKSMLDKAGDVADNKKPVTPSEESEDPCIVQEEEKPITSNQASETSVKDVKSYEPPTLTLANENQTKRSEKLINYVYYDPEIHWCRTCNVFPPTAKEYLIHLHSEEHKTMLMKHNLIDYPWHKEQSEEKKIYHNAPTERIPIRGLPFFVSASSWYCKLCNIWMGDLHCASAHLKSDIHEVKYETFLAKNPKWESEWLASRNAAYDVHLLDIRDGKKTVEKIKLVGSEVHNRPMKDVAVQVNEPMQHAKTNPFVNLVTSMHKIKESSSFPRDDSPTKTSGSDWSNDVKEQQMYSEFKKEKIIEGDKKTQERIFDSKVKKHKTKSTGNRKEHDSPSKEKQKLKSDPRSDRHKIDVKYRGDRRRHYDDDHHKPGSHKFDKSRGSRIQIHKREKSIEKDATSPKNAPPKQSVDVKTIEMPHKKEPEKSGDRQPAIGHVSSESEPSNKKKKLNINDVFEKASENESDSDKIVEEWMTPTVSKTDKEFSALKSKLKSKELEKKKSLAASLAAGLHKRVEEEPIKPISITIAPPKEKEAKKTIEKPAVKPSFIGKMRSKLLKKSDADSKAVDANPQKSKIVFKGLTSVTSEQIKLAYDKYTGSQDCSVVNMEITDDEDDGNLEDQSERKKDFNKTLEILFPESNPVEQKSVEVAPVQNSSIVENVPKPPASTLVPTSTPIIPVSTPVVSASTQMVPGNTPIEPSSNPLVPLNLTEQYLVSLIQSTVQKLNFQVPMADLTNTLKDSLTGTVATSQTTLNVTSQAASIQNTSAAITTMSNEPEIVTQTFSEMNRASMNTENSPELSYLSLSVPPPLIPNISLPPPPPVITPVSQSMHMEVHPIPPPLCNMPMQTQSQLIDRGMLSDSGESMETKKKKNPMSQKKRKRLQKIRSQLKQQERMVQEQINMLVEEPKPLINNETSESDLALLGIDEDDLAVMNIFE